MENLASFVLAVTCIHAPGAVRLTSGRQMSAGRRNSRNLFLSPEERLSPVESAWLPRRSNQEGTDLAWGRPCQPEQ
ncbi:MAG TPA: hypothetical protein VH593_10960 [Ktedonobacteraceae bacterium]